MRPLCSRAPTPFNTEKPDPLILEPRVRSRMSRLVPSSQCGKGSKSNVVGSPQIFSVLFSSSPPSGTSSSGVFGIASKRS